MSTCKDVLKSINIDMNASSYYDAILSLNDPLACEGDEVMRLKAITKQNLTFHALWTLYSADKKIDNLKQTDQLTYEMIDGWIQTATNNFL